jgi:hypothetical protein
MSSKTYTVRVPAGTPDVTSEDVGAWLDAQLASGGPLAADPGAGERTLRLSFEQDKVKAAAQAVGEPEAVFLRRLIGSNVRVPEERHEAEAKPKAPVLRGSLRLRAEQAKPLVRVYEGVQSLVIRRVMDAPEAVQEASFTEEERDFLAAATVEVLNRRAPQSLVENIDLIGLASTLVSVEFAKVEAVQEVAERKRQQQQRDHQQPAIEGQRPSVQGA